MITLRYEKIRPLCFAYVALPLWIFSVSWLKPLWALLCSVLIMLLVLMTMIRHKEKKSLYTNVPEGAKLLVPDGYSIPLSRWAIALIILLGAVWVWWSGIGGWFVQSSDFNARNAVFRDLINYDWPVIYGGEKGALVYYIGFWLPAAVIGKLTALLTSDAQTIWTVANTALYIWTLIGVYLTFLLVLLQVRAVSFKRVVVALFVFILFSGMDIIGFYKAGYPMSKMHLEWYTHTRFQYSSITTTLFWVFNQTVISWETTLAMLQEKKPHYFVFLGVMCLFNGPLPFAGFVVLALARGIQFTWQNRKKPAFFLRELFSIPNMISLFVLFPIVLTFFSCNRAVTTNGMVQVTNNKFHLDAETISYYILFIVLEVLLYLVVVAWHNRRNLVFWINAAFLLVCPFIHVGSAADFCMRASIPALVYLCMCVIRYLFDRASKLKKIWHVIPYGLLCCVLLVGAITPGVEFARGIQKADRMHTIILPCDSYKTLSNPSLTVKKVSNFVCPTYESTIFFRYFAKGNYTPESDDAYQLAPTMQDILTDAKE